MRDSKGLVFLYVLFGLAIVVGIGAVIYTSWFSDDTPVSDEPAPTTTTSLTSQTVPPDEDPALRRSVVSFLEAYYMRNPSDNQSIYLDRLKPYASEAFLSQLNLDIFDKEPFISMRDEGLSSGARLHETDVSITFDSNARDSAWVEAELDLVEGTNPDSMRLARENIVHSMFWQLDEDGWRVYPSPPR